MKPSADELLNALRNVLAGYPGAMDEARAIVAQADAADVQDETGPDESMDGDHASALASAGLGVDEDYGGCAYDDETPLGHEYEGE